MIPNPNKVPSFVRQIDISFADKVPHLVRRFPRIDDTFSVVIEPRENIQLADFSFCSWRRVFVSYKAEDTRRMRFLANALNALEVKPEMLCVDTPKGIYVYNYKTQKGNLYAV